MTEENSAHIESQQLLSEEDDIPREQFSRLPAGIWLIERVGVLSQLKQKNKKKW